MSTRTKSVKKRQRKEIANYDRNQQYKSKMRSSIKKVLASTDKTEAEMLYREAVSVIDSLESKKILHKILSYEHLLIRFKNDPTHPNQKNHPPS